MTIIFYFCRGARNVCLKCGVLMVVVYQILMDVKFKVLVIHELFYVDFQVTWLFCTSMSSRKTLFNETWLSEAQLSSWLARSNHSNKGHRKICGVTFEIGNMERQALLSHARGKKHQSKVALKFGSKKAGTGLHNYFVPSSSKEDRPVEVQGTSTTNNHRPDCDNPKPSLENLTVPQPPRETPRNQP